MSTGAGCDAGDFFANRTDYFSVASLQNMIDYMNAGLFVAGTNCDTFPISGWSDCATLIPTGNSMPSSDANVNNINGLVIPHSTPFVLTGSGSDADGTGTLTYSWEQYDTDYSGSDAPDDTATSTSAPLFRSFPPSTSTERMVPTLSSVLAGNVTTGTGETLPSVARSLTWRLTVRDNEIGGGGVACDEIGLSVGADGPFRITSQNSTTAWFAGETETITWDVANTDNPIYTCPNIDILYSTDGGVTFPITLASGATNNGSFDITVPGNATDFGRIKIVCTGGTNIFFDINDVNISIVSSCSPVGGTIANNAAVVADVGDASLNLNLLAGLPITSFSGVLDENDGNTNLTVENNGSGTCISFGNTPKFETVNLATGSNNDVTFTRTAQADYNSMIGLFDGSYNTSDVCENWLNSNGDFDGVSLVNISSGFIEPLTTSTTYVLLLSGFSSTTPPVGNFNVNFSQTLYNIDALNVPGYLYTYIIVNDDSGIIIAFDPDTDLTDAMLYPGGNYSIYGVSYLASENLSSYIGSAFNTFQSDLLSSTICGALSTNMVDVTISGYVPTIYNYNSGVWTPNDPIGTADPRDDVVIQSGDYILANDFVCDEFTVNPGASLTINNGINLNATNALKLESASTTFSSLILNGTVSGITRYDRFTALVGPTGTNDLISAPVSGQTFGAFEANNPNLPASGDLRAFAIFNTASGQYENYDTINNATTLITSGTGYRTATTDESTLTFIGTPLSTDVLDIPISDAVPGDAWNLIGNPYPSYLDFSDFFFLNQSEFDADSAYQAIYGYDGDVSNGWTIWNQATIIDNAAVELIAPGQGFFVKSKLGGGLVDFTTTMRRTGNSDDFITGFSAQDIDVALSKIDLTGPSNNADTRIYFIEGTSRGLDYGFDAGTYRGITGTFSIFSHLVEDNEGLDIAIQSLPYNDFNDIIVPLGIKAVANGELTIRLSLESTLPSSINVYLEDTVLNTITLLSQESYTFIPTENLIGVGRFFLKYSANTLSTTPSELETLVVYYNTTDKQILIKGQLTAKSKATLYDIHGRKVLNKTLDTSNMVNILDVNEMSAGVYLIMISDGIYTKVQKLVVR